RRSFPVWTSRVPRSNPAAPDRDQQGDLQGILRVAGRRAVGTGAAPGAKSVDELAAPAGGRARLRPSPGAWRHKEQDRVTRRGSGGASPEQRAHGYRISFTRT